MDNSLGNLSKLIKEKLISVYSLNEIDHLLFLMYKKTLQISSAQVLAFPETKVPNSVKNQIVSMAERLEMHEPIQYILGECEFYSLLFKVTPSVLIPRPETEELVDWIITENREKLQTVLDIGTGSGCIAITLAKKMDEPYVTATDISADALQIASENSRLNSAIVRTLQHNILSDNLPVEQESVDVLVSNPPYIAENEKQKMQQNVLSYEPHTALFVSEHDPLIFYRKIAEVGQQVLKPGGKLYFEINESFGKQLVLLLDNMEYRNIELRKDLFGKDRMIKAQKI